MALSKDFQSILWEYKLSNLNLDDSIVVERILNLGWKELTDFWIKSIWKERAKKLFIQNQRSLDRKSLNYWNIIFDIKEGSKLDSNSTMYDKLNTAIFSRNFG